MESKLEKTLQDLNAKSDEVARVTREMAELKTQAAESKALLKVGIFKSLLFLKCHLNPSAYRLLLNQHNF